METSPLNRVFFFQEFFDDLFFSYICKNSSRFRFPSGTKLDTKTSTHAAKATNNGAKASSYGDRPSSHGAKARSSAANRRISV